MISRKHYISKTVLNVVKRFLNHVKKITEGISPIYLLSENFLRLNIHNRAEQSQWQHEVHNGKLYLLNCHSNLYLIVCSVDKN